MGADQSDLISGLGHELFNPFQLSSGLRPASVGHGPEKGDPQGVFASDLMFLHRRRRRSEIPSRSIW